MRVEAYAADMAPEWDAFVSASRNGTFLFQRGFMDYHADRVVDASLLLRDGKDRLVAVLPACAVGDEWASHRYLTYGGLVVGDRIRLAGVFEALEAILGHLREAGFRSLTWRPVPPIYHRRPAEAELVALHLAGARLLERDALFALVPGAQPWQDRRKRMARKAADRGIRVAESPDLHAFWRVLEQRLQTAYGARPVHDLAEIELLRKRFPTHIRLFVALEEDTVVAGVLVFETERVARAQYIASSTRGRELGALDLVFRHLLEVGFADKPYFELGSSAGARQGSFNRGLVDQKEGFGARAVALDRYGLDLTAWRPGTLMKLLE